MSLRILLQKLTAAYTIKKLQRSFTEPKVPLQRLHAHATSIPYQKAVQSYSNYHTLYSVRINSM